MGATMRLFGYDPMGMKRKTENGSYRKPADQHTSEHFERPFLELPCWSYCAIFGNS